MYTYTTFQNALAIEMAVPNNDPTDAQFVAILQTLIDQAEQRCYRDLDLLYATSTQIAHLTRGSSKLDFSSLMPQLLILEDVNLVVTDHNVVGAAVIISDGPPAGPVNGSLWFSGADAQLYVLFVDPNSTQWVIATNQGTGGPAGGGGGGQGGSARAIVSDAPPLNPANGALWFSSSDAQLYVWYSDGDSSQWVIAINPGSGGAPRSKGSRSISATANLASVGDAPPPSPANGALWFSTTDAQLYVWYDDGVSAQWVIAVNPGDQIVGAAFLAADQGERVPLVPVSKEWLRMVYGLSKTRGMPEYYAMNDDHSILVGPFPDQNYATELIGKFRPTPLYQAAPGDGTQTTVLTAILPDLFLAAAMCAGSAYQHNWSASADDPRQSMSWETNYQTLLAPAQAEEMRKKVHGWMGLTSEKAPPPTPPATPGP
jgi:hypothetical protein